MPRGRQAVQGRMHLAEEAAQQPLPREQLAGEIADMAGLDVLGIQVDGRRPLAHRLGEGVGQAHALPGPVGREVALPAAENVDHGRSSRSPSFADVSRLSQSDYTSDLPRGNAPR